MLHIDIADDVDDKWNKFLQNTEHGTIYQTHEYAQYVKSRMHHKPIFLKFISDTGEILGQLLLFQSFQGKRKLSSLMGRGKLYANISKFSKFLPKKYFWSFGPVLRPSVNQSLVSEILGNSLISFKGIIKGKTHPLMPTFDFPKKFNFTKQLESTFLINLNHDLQTIFKNSNKNSVQKNIKRAQNRGVTISEMKNMDDYLLYYELQKNYRLRNNMIPYEKADIVDGFQLLKKLGYHGFISWYKEKPIGAITFSSFNGYINESGIARTIIDSEENLYSQDYLRWKIIEWGVQHHCRYYDFSGVQVNNRTPKEEGIFKNKKKWGGELHNYWTFTR